MRKAFPILFGSLLAILPASAEALAIGGNNICGNLLSCWTGSLDAYLSSKIYVIMTWLFVALLVLMLFFYSAKMITQSSNESSISESKLAYTYALTGAAIVSFSYALMIAFSPNKAGYVVNTAPLALGLTSAFSFFKMLLGTALTANIILQSFRLITSQGSDDLIGRARKRLIGGFIGVAIVILANAGVEALQPACVGVSCSNTFGGAVISGEIVGVANFLLTIFGTMAVVAIMIAGVLLVISVEESLKDKSKQIIRTAIIALLAILSSFALLNAFLSV